MFWLLFSAVDHADLRPLLKPHNFSSSKPRICAMTETRELTLYEKRVDALLQLLPRTDGQARETFLRTQRDLKSAPDDAQYFDRWIEALAENLAADGVLSSDELNARRAEIQARLEHWEAAE
jgi:hypothetical protein